MRWSECQIFLFVDKLIKPSKVNAVTVHFDGQALRAGCHPYDFFAA